MSAKSKVRTTVALDRDIAAAVASFRRERDLGLSEAINDLIRAGLIAPKERKPFVQRTFDAGLKVDITHVGEALEQAEGPWYR